MYENFGIPMCPLPDYTVGHEQWIPLTSLEQMAETEYDVLIVGSGAGGGAALWRLSEQWGDNGRKIGVIEAGGLLLATHPNNLPTLDWDNAEQMVKNYYIPIGLELPELPGAALKLYFGGGMLIWGCVTPRMTASKIAEWPISLQEMNYYYNAAEWIMNVNRDFGSNSSLTQVVLGRLHQHGVHDAAVRPMAVDLKPTNYGQLHSNVFFSSMIFFAYALNRRPVDIAVNARAVRVLTDNGKVTGVEAIAPDQRSYVLKAKKVVLSASTFETPRILLQSGIKGRAIGHYLTDHAAIVANAKINVEDFPEILGTLNVLVPESDSNPYQVEIRRDDKYYVYKYQAEPQLKEIPILFFASVKLESRYENYMTLDPFETNVEGMPKLSVQFSYSEKDKHAIHQAIEGVKQLVRATGASLSSVNGRPPMCLLQPGQERHYSGTCRIGYDPMTAAANPYGEIFGVSGLFVADNSMIPSTSAANPTLTTVALSIRTADYIIRQFQS